MLVVASKYNVIRYTIMMVACMSVNEIFQEPDAKLTSKQNNADVNLEEDPDLVTSLDLERRD